MHASSGAKFQVQKCPRHPGHPDATAAIRNVRFTSTPAVCRARKTPRWCTLGKRIIALLIRRGSRVLCPPRSARVEETRAGLSALGLIAEPPIVSRADHQDAMAAGFGVTEFNDTGAAAAEMRRLWQWIDAKLEGKRLARHDPIGLA
jgi:hypothetical protein